MDVQGKIGYSQAELKAKQEQLWAAAGTGDSATIRALAMEGVDVDARNPDGFTAYNLATQNGHHNTALTILAFRKMKYFGTPGLAPAYDEGREINPLRKKNF